MDNTKIKKIIEHLGQFVTDNKKDIIAHVVQDRTRYVTTVLEDIYQPQNASATIRTADCHGLQDVHVIENYNEYEVNQEVALGASKWVDIHHYNEEKNNTKVCFDKLRAKGYRIVGTALSSDSLSPAELPLDKPLAIVFGNEDAGISDYAMQHTDLNLKIPMFGFTQSFNISVSVAIVLTHLIHRLHRSDLPWRLSEREQLELQLDWYRKVVARSEIVERNFLAEMKD